MIPQGAGSAGVAALGSAGALGGRADRGELSGWAAHGPGLQVDIDIAAEQVSGGLGVMGIGRRDDHLVEQLVVRIYRQMRLEPSNRRCGSYGRVGRGDRPSR
jgi:hypothetical protein